MVLEHTVVVGRVVVLFRRAGLDLEVALRDLIDDATTRAFAAIGAVAHGLEDGLAGVGDQDLLAETGS